MDSERHAEMELRKLYSEEYIKDLRALRPSREASMRSRLNGMRRYRSCRVSKDARYSPVKVHLKTVLSRPNSVASNFDGSFRALQNQGSSRGGSFSEEDFDPFRNYHVPITPDLEVHLLQCTLPDSQPTNSALLMLDGSKLLNQSLLAPPEPGLPGQNCSVCCQLTNKLEFTHQLSCGHVCHDNCLSKILKWPWSSILKHCPTCNAVLFLHSMSGIDPSRHPDSHIAFVFHRNLIYEQGNSSLLHRVNATTMRSKNFPVLQIFQLHRPRISKGRFWKRISVLILLL